MRITRFEWNEGNEGHVARHGVDPSEAEETLRRAPYVRRGRSDRRLAYGTTADGRHLFVVFAVMEHGCVRVITARDMTPRERRAYRRRRP